MNKSGNTFSRFVISVSLAFALSACNAPPMYGARAQQYLKTQGVSNDLILRLLERRALSESEAMMLERFGDHWFQQLLPGNPITAVLHLLASNPSIPTSMIERLAGSSDEEVRRAVAYNPSTPIETLKSFRTPGAYSLMNESLARNPRMPADVLTDMYRNREANKASFAMNPGCPPELMREIAEHEGDFERTWLAGNVNLPEDLMVKLEKDPSENVQRFLSQNSAYKSWRSKKGD